MDEELKASDYHHQYDNHATYSNSELLNRLRRAKSEGDEAAGKEGGKLNMLNIMLMKRRGLKLSATDGAPRLIFAFPSEAESGMTDTDRSFF